MNQHKVETLVHELLLEIGEDPQREGLVRTPQRVAADREVKAPWARRRATTA